MITVLDPIKPIQVFKYRCDSSFCTEELKEMLEDGEQYGFIIVDGNGALFAIVQGNRQSILSRLSVSLPKKHRRGGQSSVRFARLREEARHNYLTKVSEMASKEFINPETNKCRVSGIVIAGAAEFKDHLNSSRLDPRLKAQVIAVTDIAYGFTQGLNQAVELTSELLKNVSLVRQKKLISKFFDEIAKDSKKICFGERDTMEALASGAVETLLVWENLDLIRCTLVSKTTGENKVIITKKDQELCSVASMASADQYEITESVPLVDWLAEHYNQFGIQLELVQDTTAEGSQFCKGFGGLGGILRYAVEFESIDDNSDDDDDDVWGDNNHSCKEEEESDTEDTNEKENGAF